MWCLGPASFFRLWIFWSHPRLSILHLSSSSFLPVTAGLGSSGAPVLTLPGWEDRSGHYCSSRGLHWHQAGASSFLCIRVPLMPSGDQPAWCLRGSLTPPPCWLCWPCRLGAPGNHASLIALFSPLLNLMVSLYSNALRYGLADPPALPLVPNREARGLCSQRLASPRTLGSVAEPEFLCRRAGAFHFMQMSDDDGQQTP